METVLDLLALDGPVIYSEGEEVLTHCIRLEVLDFNLDDDIAPVLLGTVN